MNTDPAPSPEEQPPPPASAADPRPAEPDRAAMAVEPKPAPAPVQPGAPRKSRFEIKQVSAPYQPKKGQSPYTKTDVILTSDYRRRARYKLVIEEPAHRVILDHIGWHAPRPENAVEQGGILVGEVVETGDGQFIGLAKLAVPCLGGRGSSTYLEMDHAAWRAMYDQVDAASKDHHDGQIIGWYHTHPQNLSIFMSGTDMATQRRMFSKPWQFAVVLNPHRQYWGVFHGADATECPGYLVKRQEPGAPGPIRVPVPAVLDLTADGPTGAAAAPADPAHGNTWTRGEPLRGPAGTPGRLTRNVLAVSLVGGVTFVGLLGIMSAALFATVAELKKKVSDLDHKLAALQPPMPRELPVSSGVPAPEGAPGIKPGSLPAAAVTPTVAPTVHADTPEPATTTEKKTSAPTLLTPPPDPAPSATEALTVPRIDNPTPTPPAKTEEPTASMTPPAGSPTPTTTPEATKNASPTTTDTPKPTGRPG